MKRYDCCNEASGFDRADDCPAIAIEAESDECEGHPAGPFDPMGVTVYCDGSCRRIARRVGGEG